MVDEIPNVVLVHIVRDAVWRGRLCETQCHHPEITMRRLGSGKKKFHSHSQRKQ